MIFRNQEAVDKYLAKLKKPQESIYWGLQVGDEGLDTDKIPYGEKYSTAKPPEPQPDITEKPAEPEQKASADDESQDTSDAKSEEGAKSREHDYYDTKSEFEWAKKSAITNVGEDLPDSARHRRNEGRNWDDIESMKADFREKKDFDRTDLDKAFPIDWSEMSDKFHDRPDLLQEAALFRSIISAFPKKPWNGFDHDDFILGYKRIHDIVTNARGRLMQGELADYQAMKNAIHQLARAEMDEARKHASWRDRNDPKMSSRLAAKFNMYAELSNGLLWQKQRSPEGNLAAIQTQAINEVLKDADLLEISQARRLLVSWKTKPTELSEREGEMVVRLQKEYAQRLSAVLKGGSIRKKGASTSQFTNLREDSFYRDIELRRVGAAPAFTDYKKGIDYMSKDIGFRGIQYGNSVSDSKKIEHALNAANSFTDMGAVLGLPPKKMSFGGKLGIAFGARGNGKAAAHYEPSTNIIAMTKENGYGALAHEWGHALDYNSRSHKVAYAVWRSEGKKSKPTPEVNLVDKIESAKSALQPMADRIKAQWRKSDPKLSPERKVYWTSSEEMFARVFESYINRKMKTAGIENTYLVAGVDSYLWPTKEELEELGPRFDEVIEAFKKV